MGENMSEKLDRKDLTKPDQKKLAEILLKSPGSLKGYELAHLKARRVYLTKAEREEFDIKSDKDIEKEAEEEEKEVTKAKKDAQRDIKEDKKEKRKAEKKAEKGLKK